MTDRFTRRREQLAKTIDNSPTSALLVAATTNVAYLTGFSGDAATLLVTRGRSILISDGRFATQIDQECPGLESHIRRVGQSMWAGVAAVCGRLRVARLEFESGALTVADFEDLREQLPTVSLSGVRGRVEALRIIKDNSEIAAIRGAVGAAERAFTMLCAGLRGSDTEKDAADALEGHLRRCGADAASFPTIVAAGARAALPHAHPAADARIGDCAFVLVDWGARRASYRSDLTRMIVTGKVTPKFAKLYQIVLKAQERALGSIRPGVTAKAVDAVARGVIEEAGFGRFFRHALGHGLGMDVHEAPILRADCDLTLRSGMVVTVEPGVYLPGWGGIRIEDDVLVTADGCEILTSAAKSLDALRLASGA